MNHIRTNPFRLLTVVLYALCLFTVLQLIFTSKVHAEYDSGRIIDDVVFLDSRSMSIADVQNFLVAKGSGLASMNFTLSCYGSDSTERQIYTSAGATCDTPIPASQIIYYGAQVYGVNPKVILATMQKEQSLTTAPNPTSWQLNQAMGYACPTSGSCGGNSTFPYQIDSGTWALRYHYERARGNMNWWHTSTSWTCGTQKPDYYRPNLYPKQTVGFYDPYSKVNYANVYIQNAATSAFYCYTPHVFNNHNNSPHPNEPKGSSRCYSSLPVAGDRGRCYTGSYNFVRFYELWFGPTSGTPFFQISGSVKTYIHGAGNTYYPIDSYSTLVDYGFESHFKQRVQQVPTGYLSGKVNGGQLPPIARFEGLGVYVVQGGASHPFTSEQMFFDYGYSFGEEASLPKWIGDQLSTGTAMQKITKPIGGGSTYLVENGKKRAFCSWQAFSGLGSPTYSTQASISLSKNYLATLPEGALVNYEGDIIYNSSSKTFGLWQNNSLNPIDADVASNIKQTNCSATGLVLSQSPQVAGTISNKVKDSSSNLFIIDASKKLSISPLKSTEHNFMSQDFKLVSQQFLNKLAARELPDTMKVNNSLGVYALKDGKRFGIPSENDLLGLGYNFNNVMGVTSKTFNTFPDGGLIFREGKVIRIGNTKGVFLLGKDFKKYPFTTEGIFLGYGYKWSDVLSVDATWVRTYADETYVNKYVTDKSGNYWLLDNGKRRAIPSNLAAAGYYNINATFPTPVSDYTLGKSSVLPNLGRVFRAGSDKAVYLIENGQKRAFTSETAFFNYGFTWNDVASLSHEYTNSIPSGSLIY